jgi:TolB-like protein/class 3 adenylate cyclase
MADRESRARSQFLLLAQEPKEAGGGPGSGRIERRLAAFLALDIKDYGAMISRDEVGAHRRVGRDQAAVVRQIHKFGGRIMHLAGDGLMAEFVSARSTLQAALAIQAGSARRNRRRADEYQIEYRIGISSGEAVVQDDRVGGNTVNIAARLEQIADPGGICITESVFEQVNGTVNATYTSLGATRLKNIRYPIRTYRVSLHRSQQEQMPFLRRAVAGKSETQEYRPSIAILPFENLSDDATHDYFSEGIVEDVIASLSGLREMQVISRSSTLGFRGGRTDVRIVGKTLGVDYVLSGSMRRAAVAIRASVELSDARTGVSLWSETTEFPMADLFEAQDQLVRHIVSRIAPHIRDEELRRAMRRRPENMTAYDHTLRALHLMDYMDKEMFSQARDVLIQAMEEDPHFAMPVAWSVWWYIIWVGQGWSSNPDDDFAAASALAERAITLDPNNALGLAMMAHLRAFLLHDYEGALVFFARAVNAGPGNPIVLAMYALTLAYVGRGEEAVRAANHAVQLSPLDHRMFLFHNIMAWAYFAKGSYAEAAKWARASHGASPRFTANIRILAASLAAIGADQEAQAASEMLMSLEPDFTLNRYEKTRLPYREPAIRAKLMACLRSAGLPA